MFTATHQDGDDRRCDWEQWGGSPEHDGVACKEVNHFNRISAHLTFDPFVDQEVADAEIQFGRADLFTHYQTPLLVDDDVYMEFKAGRYTSCESVPAGKPCGIDAWNTQIWTERAFHWSNGRLVADWTFKSDWKPEPGRLAFWEPVFHAIVVGPFVYVPGASGALHKLDRRTGRKLTTIKLPGVHKDRNTSVFVAGGIVSDVHGNLYYNALALSPVDPNQNPPSAWRVPGAWLVKVKPDDTVVMAEFSEIVDGAPTADDDCFTQFSLPQDPQPWPPAPDAVPPSAPCGPQRPPINVTPAVRADGTIVTISTAHNNPRYTFVVAVDANLKRKWTTSLRDQLNDGCGVTVPINAPGTTDPAHCRTGTTVGVDPATNQAPAGQATDQGTSSPMILPDGGVLYGAYTDYNQFRGHLFKLDARGNHAGTYDFGWDVTPAVYRHDGTYSIVTKDNYYVDEQFYITQLSPQLHREWTFKSTNTEDCHRDTNGQIVCVDDGQHPTGFEWCVNAPAVDLDGNVYANSEDGWVYKIRQGGRLDKRTFLLESLGAAYTPISVDRHGRLFSLNGGDLFVIGGDQDHD